MGQHATIQGYVGWHVVLYIPDSTISIFKTATFPIYFKRHYNSLAFEKGTPQYKTGFSVVYEWKMGFILRGSLTKIQFTQVGDICQVGYCRL
jgi:hypothetical protein